MNGHIRRRGKNQWAIIVELAAEPETGKRRQQAKAFHGTKKEAEAELRDILTKLERGEYVKPNRITVAEYLKLWLKDYAPQNARERTTQGYRGIIDRYLVPAIGNLRLQELEPRHLRGLYTKLKERALSARTVLHAHRVIRKALADGMGEYVSVNVADAKAARPDRPAVTTFRALDAAGVHTLLEAAEGSPYETIFALALYTGMRRSELVGLTWAAVDLDAGALGVTQGLQRIYGKGLVETPPKTAKSRRRVALSPQAVAILKRQHARQAEQIVNIGRDLWAKGDWVFTRPDGRPLDPDEVTHAFTKLARACDFRGLRLHDLRHSHATLMMANGVHPKIVSERLGHATIQITLDTYSHALPGLQEAAALVFDEGLRVREEAAAYGGL